MGRQLVRTLGGFSAMIVRPIADLLTIPARIAALLPAVESLHTEVSRMRASVERIEDETRELQNALHPVQRAIRRVRPVDEATG